MKINISQQKVLDGIIKWVRENGYSPNLRELCKVCGLRSTWTVRYHLKKLEDFGYIKVSKRLARGIFLLKNLFGVPLVGKISAGKPVEAIENIEDYIDIKNFFDLNQDIFALRVKGDSMIGAGIFEGDIVFVNKQSVVKNGDIVVALVGDDAVVKRFYFGKEAIKLVSENNKYEPIISSEVKVIGKVVGVLRKYGH